jgi:ubiquitin
LGGRGRRISEFEASLVYRVSSRTARVTQRNPVSKNQRKKRKRKRKERERKEKEKKKKEEKRFFFLSLLSFP